MWYNGFREGREDVNGNVRPGRTSTSTTDEYIGTLKEMILDNRRITIREVAGDVGLPFVSCQAIFTDVLGTQSAAAKMVPKLLNFDQK